MKKKTIVIYKSVTGFTSQYAAWIAEELNCETTDWKTATAELMSNYDTVIFGGRLHAGMVDGLKKMKEIFEKSSAEKLVVFASGATPAEETKILEETWNNNFTSDERKRIPCFYMQSGLRYERLPLADKLMIKVFAAMLRRKKEKNDYERAVEQALGSSCDCSSRKYTEPLVAYVTEMNGMRLKI